MTPQNYILTYIALITFFYFMFNILQILQLRRIKKELIKLNGDLKEGDNFDNQY